MEIKHQCSVCSILQAEGVKRNSAEAMEWYHKAAAQGNAQAQFNLGSMYFEGEGVPKDPAQAVVWYRKAAEQGDSDAQHNLGVISWCWDQCFQRRRIREHWA